MDAESRDDILRKLADRFAKNLCRHRGVEWEEVEARLRGNASALGTLGEMERTGGEPDVIGRDDASGEFLFCDCSPESPQGRRSLCYDRQALDSRKEHKPAGSAVETAESMGVELLTEAKYRALQELGDFDTKTSSWVRTPSDVRSLGGALFCDRRYGRVFVYHNGADSYYSSRGFRGLVKV